MWNKANIVKLVQVTQHKPVATSNIKLWADHYVMAMRKTADHVDARLKTVCRAVQNHVITPCTICHHACEVGIPRWISINKMKQFRAIQL